jgi:hypothetical protein
MNGGSVDAQDLRRLANRRPVLPWVAPRVLGIQEQFPILRPKLYLPYRDLQAIALL